MSCAGMLLRSSVRRICVSRALNSGGRSPRTANGPFGMGGDFHKVDIVLRLVEPGQLRAGDRGTVQFAHRDLVVAQRLEARRVRSGVERRDVLLRVDAGLDQAVGWE